jgi:DNA-binding NarL/FixJ family response regulator
MARGLPTRQIATQLVRSPKMVERHIESIFGGSCGRRAAAVQ